MNNSTLTRKGLCLSMKPGSTRRWRAFGAALRKANAAGLASLTAIGKRRHLRALCA